MRRVIGLAVVLMSLVMAAGAQAAVTTSSITAPSDPFFGFDQGQTQNVTISGTSNGTTGDSVDIDCYVDNGSTGSSNATIASGVSVRSDGSFSTSVAISKFHATYNDYSPCRLRAVPSGTTPTTGLSSFSGPRVSVGDLLRDTDTSGALYDYYAYAPQLSAADDYDSFGSCGLDDSYLFDPSFFGQQDSTGFYCNDWADNPTESNSSRTALLVDGHPAYAPDEEDGINSNAAGFEALTINSITQNSSNGNLTIVETDPLVRCWGDPYPANNTNCLTFEASGVQVKRTITQNDDGHIVYVRDAYSSTDGAAHSVNLLMENDQHFFESGGSQDVQYEFPAQSLFSAYNAGRTVSVPSGAPASILVENAGTADGATNGGRGAITYAQSPSGPFAFGLNNSCCSDFDAPNTVSVPSSGSASIAYGYSSEFTLAAARHDALVAQDAFAPPTIKIASPRNHSKAKATPVKVTGTVTAGSGVKSVKVNGVTAKVSGRKFSASVKLHRGKNKPTVRLTSDAGNTVTKSITVTLPYPSARTRAARNVAGSAATLAGLVRTRGLHVSYYFQYGTSKKYGRRTHARKLKGSRGVTKVKARVSGLATGATYHYRLVVVYSKHHSKGDPRVFTTWT